VRPGPNNALPTGYTYTGQLDSGLGLMYYRARHYDPLLGRFVQPDTIVPEPGNPQALNRYSYVLNNPLRYTDPTGMFSEEAIWNYIFDRECSGNSECASKMYSQWQRNTQWWSALLSASANDLLMAVNPFTESMSFYTFQGEGQTLLTGMMATTNPFVIEHGSSDLGSVALSSIYNGGLGGVLPVAVANKDFRGTFTQMHGINDYAVRLRTIDSQLALGYSILWNVFVAGALLPVALESPAVLVLVELGGAIGAEMAYSALSRNIAVKEGDQTLMVSYGGAYGAVFAQVSGRYGATYGWHVRWHNPNGR
jgi:RHS repeat-associated protein